MWLRYIPCSALSGKIGLHGVQDALGPMLLGSMRDLFLQELESLLIDMDGDELAGSPETQVLPLVPYCMQECCE